MYTIEITTRVDGDSLILSVNGEEVNRMKVEPNTWEFVTWGNLPIDSDSIKPNFEETPDA